jgi:hypothetical protein
MFLAKKNINLYLMHYPDFVQIMSLHLLLWLIDASSLFDLSWYYHLTSMLDYPRFITLKSVIGD